MPAPSSHAGALAALGELPSRFTQLDGLRIHYKVTGAGEPAVLFVHGWTCDHTFWSGQVAELAPRHRLLLIDLPGHGLSDKPEIDYSQTLFARALHAVLAAEGVPRAVLVGHSMGTPVVRQFHRLFPQETVALAAVDGSLQSAMPDEASVEAWLAPLREDFAQQMPRAVDGMLLPVASAELRERIRGVMLATPRHVTLSAAAGMFDPSITGEDPIGVPLLVIQAGPSGYETLDEELARALAADMEFHVVKGVSHFLMLDRPAEFNALLLGFLERQAATR